MTSLSIAAKALQDFLGPDIARLHTKKELFDGHPVTISNDAFGERKLVLIIDDTQITNPELSPCGRFHVDPQLAYGLSPSGVVNFKALQEALAVAVEESLDTMCAIIQERLNVSCGGFAGLYFSGGEPLEAMKNVVWNYIEAELNNM